MRNLALFVLIISLVSCNQTIEKNSSSIETFEKLLGEPETTYLNEIVSDLNNYLSSNYPDHESRFKSYLVDIPELNLIDFYRIDSVKLIKYGESNLFGQYVTFFPDSVWYDGLTYKIKFPNSDFITEILPIPGKKEKLDIDSIISSLENKPEIVLTEQSKFILALDSIKQSDSLISTYLDVKEALVDLSPSTLSDGIRHYLNDNNEYFAKRILIMDLYEKLRNTVANNGEHAGPL
jgi:hypothetical protein